MCRFVVYCGGKRLLLADLLTNPKHSIIKQSLDSKERIVSPVNGDGFGVGWYDNSSNDSTPCVFVGTTPAWNNSNLHRLANHISSHLIFAHIRAASPGSPTNESNCHPFVYGKLMFMHNGDIPVFPSIKRKMMMLFPEHIFATIQGSTDSEFCFCLFLAMLEVEENKSRDYTGEELIKV